jgi:hypothetical protein
VVGAVLVGLGSERWFEKVLVDLESERWFVV